MKASQLDSIKKQLWDIHIAIRDLTDDEVLNGREGAFRQHFERLQHLIAMDIDDQAADELLCDPELRSATKRISHLKTLNGLRMEIEGAQSIITGPDPWALIRRFPFYPNYQKLARMEYEGAHLKPGDRVVFLGSGPLPLSLICLCKQYGLKGIGIEKVPEYVELSGKLLQNLELTGHIHIVQGDHFKLPVQQTCGLIMVAADACPKDEIFAHLAKALSKGTKLSYRIYEKGLRRLMDDQPVSGLPPEFKEYRRIRPEPPVNNTSVFLVKTGR